MGNLLKIGVTTVGLRGLEGAINELLNIHQKNPVSPEEAAQILLEKLKTRNYIPSKAVTAYIKALRLLWLKKTGHNHDICKNEKIVRILGSGCIGCNRLESMVMEIFQEQKIAADIEHIQDMDEIWRYGVVHTPALVFGEQVVSSGKIPSKAMVKDWIREYFNQ